MRTRAMPRLRVCGTRHERTAWVPGEDEKANRSARADAAADVPLATAPTRQANSGRGAAALLALEGQRAAMHFDEGLGDGEAKPRAVIAAGEGAIDLAERLERPRDLFGRHADTGIADHDQEIAAAGFALGRDADMPAR